MFSRPADYVSRPRQRINLPQRLSARAALLFGGVTSLLLWLGLVALFVKLW